MRGEQSAQTGLPSGQEPQPGTITPELVRAIAGRVYAMILADLKIERERFRPVGAGSQQARRRR